MDKLIILCSFSDIEQSSVFLTNELGYIPKEASAVVLPVTRASNSPRTINSPVAIDISFTRKLSFAERLLGFLQTVTSRAFYSELGVLLRRRKLCLHNIIILYEAVRSAACSSRAVAKKYFNLLSDTKDPATIYAFWLSAPALAGALLKRRFPHVRFISRCHGYDCLEERASRGYLPGLCFTLRELDTLYPASGYAAAEIAEKYPWFNKVEVRFLGTQTQQKRVFANAKHGEPFMIVSCSRAHPVKRIDLMIEALALLDGHAVRWVHLGDGELLSELKSLADDKLKATSVSYQFMGALPHADILRYYRQNDAHLFVHTSRSEGGPSMAAMEALSFGTPVVATDSGGVRDSVIAGRGGTLLAHDAPPQEIADAILDIMRLPDFDYIKMRKAAYELWCERFDRDANYKHFYEELMG